MPQNSVPSALPPSKIRKPGQWQPGQSGNPGGRPSTTTEDSLTYWLRIVAQRKDPTTGKRNLEIVAMKIWELAAKGSPDAMRILLDRLDGRTPDVKRIEGGKPITFTFQFHDGRGTPTLVSGEESRLLLAEAVEGEIISRDRAEEGAASESEELLDTASIPAHAYESEGMEQNT